MCACRVWVRCSPSKLFYYTEPRLSGLTRWLNRITSRQRDPTMLAQMRLEEFAMRLQRDNPLPPIHYKVRSADDACSIRSVCSSTHSVPKCTWRNLPCACIATMQSPRWTLSSLVHAGCTGTAQASNPTLPLHHNSGCPLRGRADHLQGPSMDPADHCKF